MILSRVVVTVKVLPVTLFVPVHRITVETPLYPGVAMAARRKNINGKASSLVVIAFVGKALGTTTPDGKFNVTVGNSA
jgi:hypothetical protein